MFILVLEFNLKLQSKILLHDVVFIPVVGLLANIFLVDFASFGQQLWHEGAANRFVFLFSDSCRRPSALRCCFHLHPASCWCGYPQRHLGPAQDNHQGHLCGGCQHPHSQVGFLLEKHSTLPWWFSACIRRKQKKTKTKQQQPTTSDGTCAGLWAFIK